MGNVTELNESNFDAEVVQSAKPVLVDFWAPRCMPCRAIAPVMEQLAAENADAIKVVKIDVDQFPSLAVKYGVDAIPAIMLFKGGNVVESFRGIQPKTRLQDAIDAAVA
jgi:thioredoxin 1